MSYLSEDRSTWPAGPWSDEADERRWVDEATGLECWVRRGPMGAWCGYVGVTPDSPLRGLSYYTSSYDIEEVLSGKAAASAPLQAKVNGIEVHGGLTYSGNWSGQSHWFGFDCSHYGDLSPRLLHFDSWEGVRLNPRDTYRTQGFVEGECVKLAAQLAQIGGDS